MKLLPFPLLTALLTHLFNTEAPQDSSLLLPFLRLYTKTTTTMMRIPFATKKAWLWCNPILLLLIYMTANSINKKSFIYKGICLGQNAKWIMQVGHVVIFSRLESLLICPEDILASLQPFILSAAGHHQLINLSLRKNDGVSRANDLIIFRVNIRFFFDLGRWGSNRRKQHWEETKVSRAT